jgi:hypothetical protein
VVDGTCRLLVAVDARRGGDRAMAHTYALEVATSSPAEPRLLAHTAQLLLNLGESRRAEELIGRAATYAGPAYPPLTWATLGVRINRGEVVPADRLPRGRRPRRAPAGGPRRPRPRRRRRHRRPGGEDGPAAVSADPDSGLVRALSRVQQAQGRRADGPALHDGPSGPPSPSAPTSWGCCPGWGGRRHLAGVLAEPRPRGARGSVLGVRAVRRRRWGIWGRRRAAGTIPAECERKRAR